MRTGYSTFFCVLLVWLLACTGSREKPTNKFSDPILLHIADLKDRRLADSLYPYLDNAEALYRREAAEAFGTLQDTTNVDKLGKRLLMDSDSSVRKAAAFALGQINHQSCERLLLGALVKEKVPSITSEILHAYGKATNRWNLDPQPFLGHPQTSTGLAWSLYRAGLREKTDSIANRVAERLLRPELPISARLGAAHYFARAAKNFAKAESALIATATRDSSAEVRMTAALALGKIPTDSTLATLKSIVAEDADYRVAVNAVRALRGFPFEKVGQLLYSMCRHRNLHIGIAASELVRDLVPEENWIDAFNQVNHATDLRIIANLCEGALRSGQNKSVAAEVRQRYTSQENPYYRAFLLASLKHYPEAYTFVREELHKADTPVVRSAAAETLVAMNYSSPFSKKYQSAFATMFGEILSSSKDPAVLGTIASALADSSLGYRAIITDPAFLYEARGRLRSPEHIEALQPIEKAIAYFERRTPLTIGNEYNHPIDWQLVRQVPDDQRATIKTTRGNIVIRLRVNEAPGTVANFIALAQRDYFDDKFFHRVVPNFVIQAGCKRGDGLGSEDYSLRSEFTVRRFNTGSVGMASAGKDTEGTQWFITHSPTPHLDGRYTHFAEVEDGMKVVEFIQVGDKITDVVIENFPAQ